MAKKAFFDSAKAAAEQVFNKQDKIKISIIPINPNPRSQYHGVVYFIKVKFEEHIRIGERVIIGLHIMPYRITEDDIKNAVEKDSKGKFNAVVAGDARFVDFDSGSGNFHKMPDNNFQVVLVDANSSPAGPGSCSYESREKNKEMYFPRPNDKHDRYEISELIEIALKYINDNEQEAE